MSDQLEEPSSTPAALKASSSTSPVAPATLADCVASMAPTPAQWRAQAPFSAEVLAAGWDSEDPMILVVAVVIHLQFPCSLQTSDLMRIMKRKKMKQVMIMKKNVIQTLVNWDNVMNGCSLVLQRMSVK